MNSIHSFPRLIATLALGWVAMATVQAQPQEKATMSTTVFTSTKERDRMLTAYFNRLSAPQHLKATSPNVWKKRRSELKKKLMRSCGLDPLPPRIPLNPVYGGKLDRGDYTLTRVYLQSWPNIYMSGWLYMPKTTGKHPGILSPHGHWDNGNMHEVPQSRDIVLAKKGYVVFAPDTVHTDTAAYLIGLSSVTVQVWNGFRGVDFLVSLPEVDTQKIGCTGASGGGLQTMYAMALDDRVKVAVPTVYVSYFQKIMNPDEWAHCICNWVPGLLSYTDEPEIASMFAPKPTLFICVTGDWTARVPSEEYPEMKSIWTLLSADKDVDIKQHQSQHDYSKPMRQWMYAWFNKYLKGIEDPQEAMEPEIKTEDLTTMQGLNIKTPGSSSFDQLPAYFHEHFGFKAVQLQTADEVKSYQKKIRKGLAALLGDVSVKGSQVGESAPISLIGLKVEKLRIKTEPEIEVPALLFVPDNAKRARLTVILAPQGKKVIVDQYADVIKKLVAEGSAVLLPDLRLTGELGRNWEWNTVHWGRPAEGMALTDLRVCLNVLSARSNLDVKHATLIGLGEAGVRTLLIGALEPRFASVIVENLGKTYKQGRLQPTISNLARLADLPEIAACIAPRSLTIGGAKGFEFAGHVYSLVNNEKALNLHSGKLGAEDLVQ